MRWQWCVSDLSAAHHPRWICHSLLILWKTRIHSLSFHHLHIAQLPAARKSLINACCLVWDTSQTAKSIIWRNDKRINENSNATDESYFSHQELQKWALPSINSFMMLSISLRDRHFFSATGEARDKAQHWSKRGETISMMITRSSRQCKSQRCDVGYHCLNIAAS